MDHEPMTDAEYAAALAHLERLTGPHAPPMTADDLALARRTNVEGERRRQARDEREQRERAELHARTVAAHRGITITRSEPVDLTPGHASNPVRAHLITCWIRTLAVYVAYRDTKVAEAREAAEQNFGWKRLGRGGPRTYAGGNSEVWQCPTCQEVAAC